jgi:hypothetical protein
MDDPVLVGTMVLRQSTSLRIVTMAAMSLASAFPIIAIVALNYVQATSVRLGLMAIFTVTFSSSLTLFSNATKAEAFSASAAFAAVQV